MKQAYQQSLTDLKAGDLGAYQADVNRMESDLNTIQQLTGSATPASTPSTSTTTTPSSAAGGKTTTTTTTPKSSTTTTSVPKPKAKTSPTPSTAPA